MAEHLEFFAEPRELDLCRLLRQIDINGSSMKAHEIFHDINANLMSSDGFFIPIHPLYPS